MSSQFELNNMIRTSLEQTIVINQIITMFYAERERGFEFHGEYHDFWEFLYVDKGEIVVTADDSVHYMSQGSIIFHKPNEFHRFHATKGTAPNIIVMTFDCDSQAMKQFDGQIIRLENEERNLLAQIIAEGQNAFKYPFDHPLQRREDAPVGSEQLMQNYLEIFLIRLLRRNVFKEVPKGLSTIAREKRRDELTERIIAHMKENVCSHLTVAGIADHFHISRTQVTALFKENTGHSMKEYFNKLKMERAKQYIRENTDSLTEIADMLGFSSIHAFSGTFKKWTGMSPSEYARSVIARVHDKE
ncbi:helix-turn-helix domain-containing protein [Paenibacillus mendelii]|uniref:Helix-turn-helix domain-containing protein n=1 Tax=Paenibacillus mendelii TaxID=206163 RepID=A0ABV6J2J7_9BACL|nr:helix-turn-helix domain-containing protein [Paenibacillus mendelii]MCQ6563227.1 AraC family transcriptional regulator [Paenibacillus mendelii]